MNLATVDYTLDWVTCSFDWGVNHRLYMPSDAFSAVTERIQPLPAYNRSIKLNVGRLDWHSERQEQRRLITISGSQLRLLAGYDVTQVELLQGLRSLPGSNFTRLDFAVDILGGEVVADDVRLLLEMGYVDTKAKRTSNIEERVIGEAGSGMTVYIGSRSSQSMVRVYDKGKKEKTSFPWLRVELESKQDKANKIADAIIAHGVASAGVSAIKSFVKIDCPEIESALNGELAVDLRVGRKQTNWERWVINVALPAVAAGYEKGLEDVVRWVKDVRDDKAVE